MFQIIAAMTEFERALIAERVRAGMRNARAKESGLAAQQRHTWTKMRGDQFGKHISTAAWAFGS